MKDPQGMIFTCHPYGSAWLVSARDARGEQITAAAGSDPWDAAWRCAGYVLFRMRAEVLA